MKLSSLNSTSLLLAVSAVSWSQASHAADAGPLSVHGAVSETLAYSDRYNYLGDTDRHLSSVNDEITLNTAKHFQNGLRLSVQLYAYKVSGYKDITLDFASLDYAFSEKFGVRVGRVKEPWGLYGESQDVDQIRPFALLPQTEYQKDLRPLNATFDGATLYGVLSFGKFGSVDYEAFGGRATPSNAEQPAVRNIIGASTPINIDHFEAPHKVLGAGVTWNTPIAGLRVGVNYVKVYDIVLSGTVKTADELALAPSDLRYAAAPLGNNFAGQHGEITLTNAQPSYFAEYTFGDWQFSGEYFRMLKNFERKLPFDQSHAFTESQFYTLMGTYQATSKLQVGAYYTVDYADAHDRNGDQYHAVPKHLAWTKDLTGAVAYNFAPWWVAKVEAHAIDGTSILAPGMNDDAANWKQHWGYYVFKNTLSF